MEGCSKTSKGPSLVHRTTENEKEKWKRSVAKKIFAGLKKSGNFNLPKHPNSIDILKALCEEAGWHVKEDGTLHKKERVSKMPSLTDIADSQDQKSEDEGFGKCGVDIDLNCVDEPEETTLTLKLF